MPQIIWTIRDLERHTETGVVTKVFWKCQAIEDDLVSEMGDMAPIYENKEEIVTHSQWVNFIPFDELTEQKLLEYLFEYLGDYGVQKINSDLIASLEKQKELKNHTNGLPW